MSSQDLQRATQLFSEMARCGVERNVHTYTALMNVCIKCQNCPRALETYNTMRQSGCFPNVVTYNTLIECVQPLVMSIVPARNTPCPHPSKQ